MRLQRNRPGRANSCRMQENLLHITFLGTGTSSGVPMIACDCIVCRSADPKNNRLRSSILVESGNTTVVIDTTPDFRYQMLRANVKRLDAVVYTHGHKDHIAGLDDVRAYNFFQQRDMPLYTTPETEASIRREFAYAFMDHKYPGIPDLKIHTFEEEPFTIGDIEFNPIQVWHLRMEVWGFRIGNFTYITDANRIEPAQLDKIKGSEVLVLNALRMEQHISHFSLPEAISLVQHLEIPTAYFTHISHQLGLHEEVDRYLPEGMHLAYDGLKIQLSYPRNSS
jgi:phosphoribosyl 1,2-cyclic phosphate phosphodiesterase